MIEYCDVLPDSVLLNDIELLYTGSFPPAERRNFANVKILLGREDVPFKMIAAVDAGELQGFLSYWEFDGFKYIEHFAVDVRKRGNGIGSGLLEHFISDCGDSPIVLEVELPETSYDARRRVDFYMRHCFIIWKRLNYVQPAYEKDGEPVVMRLMSLKMNDQVKVAEMGEVIRREVYKSIEEY